jgi:adenosylmethionine-8-amino-7-oxononanoate aminotransferase
LQRLDREIAVARQQQHPLLKVIHGYGSSGEGGDIRIAVQSRLRQLVAAGQIRGCIFGEDWSTSDEVAWRLICQQPEVKGDKDLGRRNQGITVILV